MIELPHDDFEAMQKALEEDDVAALTAALNAAAAHLGQTSWRKFKVPGRTKYGGLLWEAAARAAPKSFVEITGRLFDPASWGEIDESERRQRSMEFGSPLFALHVKLSEGPDRKAVLEQAFAKFFAKDGVNAPAALEEFRQWLPEAMRGPAGGVASAQFATFEAEGMATGLEAVGSAGRSPSI